ncbi:MAG: hypothetical protein ABIV63_09510, partial [Caldimonas sp.]
YYPIRNHLVDFLVARSKDLSDGRAPAHPPVVTPGLDAGSAATPADLAAPTRAPLNVVPIKGRAA